MLIATKASFYFAISGFFTAIAISFYLWNFVCQNSCAVLGINDRNFLAAIPFFIIFIAAFWAKTITLHQIKHNALPMSVKRWFVLGSYISICTFLTYMFIHMSLVSYGESFQSYVTYIIPLWLFYSMFALILFVWPAIIVGGFTGVLFSRLNSNVYHKQ